MTIAEDIIFKAIADPTRRKIIQLLSLSDRSVKELNASFPISQPAISQHLRELRSANLVQAERVGAENRYRLTGAPLREVYEWSRNFRAFFDPAGHAWAYTASSSGIAEDSPLVIEHKKGRRSHGD